MLQKIRVYCKTSVEGVITFLLFGKISACYIRNMQCHVVISSHITYSELSRLFFTLLLRFYFYVSSKM
uniref:Uncharacterized protein n=1 Tax=Ciona savignyi TaxID=51511 RepID=H2ZN71_CIOSA